MSAGNIGITVTAWVPPDGYCPTTWQQASQDIINNTTFAVTQPQADVVLSNVKPSQTQNGTLWVETVGTPPFTGISPGDSTPIALWSYDNSLAAWVWPNPVPPNSAYRALWFDTEANLVFYDGGDAGSLGSASGSMWVVDHTFDQSFILSPGIIPATADGIHTALTVTVGQTQVTSGQTSSFEFYHQLSNPEMPQHNHLFSNYTGGNLQGWQTWVHDPSNVSGTVGLTSTAGQTDDGLQYMLPSGGSPTTPPAYAGAAYHNNMPPWVACFVIKRTSRTFYKHS